STRNRAGQDDATPANQIRCLLFQIDLDGVTRLRFDRLPTAENQRRKENPLPPSHCRILDDDVPKKFEAAIRPRNIDLQSVRPAELYSAEKQRQRIKYPL